MSEERHPLKPNRVSRKDSDEVFEATATEPLRKHRNPVQLSQPERDRNNAEGERLLKKHAKDKREKKYGPRS